MHLLDTSTLTDYLKRHDRIIRRAKQLPSDAEIGTTIVCVYEILIGRYEFLTKASDRKELLRAQDLLTRDELELRTIDIARLTPDVADRFDALRRDKRCRKIGRRDLLIAAIVLANDAILVTRNVRHFGLVPDLQIENWTD